MNASTVPAADPVDAMQGWWRPALGTLAFLGVPVLVLLVARLALGEIPPKLLYLVAGAAGLTMAVRLLRDPEWLLAVVTLYLPFSKSFVAPIAPGVNATNLLELLLIVGWIVHARRDGVPLWSGRPFTRLVTTWAVLSLASVATAMVTLGPWYITTDRLPMVKGWLDQFIIFFAMVHLIRDGRMARRLSIYLVLALTLVVMYSFDEWLDKRWYDRIEKARLLGPHLQPNDLGAYIVYGFGIPAAWVLTNLWRVRTWVLAAPLLYMSARVLLATFSRGSIIGMGALAAALLVVRGRVFAAVMAAMLLLVVEVAPEVLPESMQARMSQTTDENSGELDKSSQTRLILWTAALAITAEHPLTGTGFASFPAMKEFYVSEPTVESDNHNMFLFIASQMGVPALLTFVGIVALMFWRGALLYSRCREPVARTLGLGCAATAAGLVAINMFGSRMVDIGVSGPIWIALAMLSRLWAEHLQVVAHAEEEARIELARLERVRLESQTHQTQTRPPARPAGIAPAHFPVPPGPVTATVTAPTLGERR